MSQIPPIQPNPNQPPPIPARLIQPQPAQSNPYAYVHVNESQTENRFESMRREYLSHEASTKSIGTLYMLGGCILVLMGAFYTILFIGLLVSPNAKPAIDVVPLMILATIFLTGVGVLQIMVARGLWELKKWSRIVATIFAAFGLIGFPIGTMINGYFLYLLLSKKGEVVFSDEYKHVIAETPHIKYKTSTAVWVVLFLLVGLIVAAIVFAVMNSRS